MRGLYGLASMRASSLLSSFVQKSQINLRVLCIYLLDLCYYPRLLKLAIAVILGDPQHSVQLILSDSPLVCVESQQLIKPVGTFRRQDVELLKDCEDLSSHPLIS